MEGEEAVFFFLALDEGGLWSPPGGIPLYRAWVRLASNEMFYLWCADQENASLPFLGSDRGQLALTPSLFPP